jgi:hypothetical protein
MKTKVQKVPSHNSHKLSSLFPHLSFGNHYSKRKSYPRNLTSTSHSSERSGCLNHGFSPLTGISSSYRHKESAPSMWFWQLQRFSILDTKFELLPLTRLWPITSPRPLVVGRHSDLASGRGEGNNSNTAEKVLTRLPSQEESEVERAISATNRTAIFIEPTASVPIYPNTSLQVKRKIERVGCISTKIVTMIVKLEDSLVTIQKLMR